MKTVFQIILFIGAIALAYFIYKGVQDPIDFDKAKDIRYEKTKNRLKDIRKAQIAFKDVHGKFTGSFDTLVDFVANGTVNQVRKVGELTDSMIEAGLTEKKAIKKGLLIRDTLKVKTLEAIFNNEIDPQQLRYLPVGDKTKEFKLGATIITTGSGIKVPVFEAKAHNNNILKGLERQYIININEQKRANEKYPGLKVGSLTEVNNNAGNWEK